MKVKELIEKLQKQDPEDEIHIIVNHCKIGESIDGNIPFNHYSYICDVRDEHEYFIDIDNEVNTKEELIDKIEEENEIDAFWNNKEIQDVIHARMKKQKKIKGLWIGIEA